MDGLLTSTEVTRRAGISYRQLDYWTRAGVAHPVIGARGSGTQRLWTEEEARTLGDMATWAALGVRLERAREMAERGARVVYDDTPLLQLATA